MRDTASILPMRVTGLRFEVEGRRLIDDVGFELPKGGVTALLGPNGAGKSLLLRLCHGLIQPSAGDVRFNAPAAGRHAMVFQRPVMLRRSAAANIRHAAAALSLPDVAARTQAALLRFGLEALADRPARLLSGGEQQRLAIARAFALSPELLFLDEPTSQLDPGATRRIEEMVAGLAAEGMTLLMTTHDLGQARRLASRILFLHGGRLLEDREAAAFFSAPATAEARAFLSGDLLW
jgi:tungstate transport system ATP-binding protein